MITSLLFALAMFSPYKYHEFFDTTKSVTERYKKKYERMQYFGMSDALVDVALDGLYSIHEAICTNLKQDPALDDYSISPQIKEKVVAYRKEHLKHFEQECIDFSRVCSSLQNYISLEGDGDHRYYRSVANSIYRDLAFFRIEELKKRYVSTFNKKIEYQHLIGDWTAGDAKCCFQVGYKYLDRPWGYWIQDKGGKHHGNWTAVLREGRLEKRRLYVDCKDIDFKNAVINIPHTNDVRTLEIGSYPTHISTQDSIPLKIVEKALIKQLDWLASYLVDNIKEVGLAVKESHQLIQEYVSIAFDQRVEMLPDGTTYTSVASAEKNRYLYQFLLALEGAGRMLPNRLLLGPYEEGNQVWTFTEDDTKVIGENERFFTTGLYKIEQDGSFIESGSYSFNEGELLLFPKEGSRPIPTDSKPLTPEEGQLWFEYLFGPLVIEKIFTKTGDRP